MFWNRINDWFSDLRERYSLLRDFNKSARNAYVNGDAHTLLEARITIGSLEYRHSFSKWMAGGFRIKALSGRALNREELKSIGNVIIQNEILVRRLVALGWDTLEIHDDTGFAGLKWELNRHTGIGGHLN